ncbi:MAG: ATP-binding protein [Sulfuricurvum sp.]
MIDAILSTNIISKTDPNGIITFVNDEFVAISGYKKEELLGQNHNIIRHSDTPKESFEKLWSEIKAGRIYKSTVKNRAKDGSAFYVNTTIIPVLDASGEVSEYIAIRYDVTNEMLLKEELLRKDEELERRLKEQTKELRELNRTLKDRIAEEVEKNEQKQAVMFWQSRHASLGQMLANIAHQWRQPLMEMSLVLYALKKNRLDEAEFDTYYDDAKMTLQNLSKTIEEFSNFFNPSRSRESFSINSAIEEALFIASVGIKEASLSIRRSGGDASVMGSQNELAQVLVNLINNAKDAFLKSGVLFREIRIDVRAKKESVVITFSDNAGGISEDLIERVFEPYFTTKHKSRGTGLGLFMSKMITEQGFGGKMDLSSKDGSTLFTITLPRIKNEDT